MARSWLLLMFTALMAVTPARAYAFGKSALGFSDAAETLGAWRVDAQLVERVGENVFPTGERSLGPQQWLKQGPIGLNPYQYGGWSPVRNVDPDGRCVPALVMAAGLMLSLGSGMQNCETADLTALPVGGAGRAILEGTYHGYALHNLSNQRARLEDGMESMGQSTPEALAEMADIDAQTQHHRTGLSGSALSLVPVKPCFAAGTLVETSDGPRAIEGIQVGDQVLARSESTGETALRKVVSTSRRSAARLVALTLVNRVGTGDVLLVTPEHPFWMRGVGWVGAGDLPLGASVAGATGELVVSEVRPRAGEDVFNFEVEEFSSYFVGHLKAWVHNACGGAHSDVKGTGRGHSHHTPADAISPLPSGLGPAVFMSAKDHQRTASYGGKKSAQEYRERQRKIIEQGDFRGAVQMDIDDIRSKFGNKYDKGIEKMLQHLDSLGL